MGADRVIEQVLACISKALSEIGAGTWPDWVAAIGTSLAFGIAALAYRRDVRTRREAQARRVYSVLEHVAFYNPGDRFQLNANGAKTGMMPMALDLSESRPNVPVAITPIPVYQVTVRMHNGSDELVALVKVQMIDFGLKKRDETTSISVAAVEPHGDTFIEIIAPNVHHPNQPSLIPTILFRDSSGQWWRRNGTDEIERVHDDPENALALPAQRAAGAAVAKAHGWTPTPEPKVPVAARWHRFWRKRRGKSPTP